MGLISIIRTSRHIGMRRNSSASAPTEARDRPGKRTGYCHAQLPHNQVRDYNLEVIYLPLCRDITGKSSSKGICIYCSRRNLKIRLRGVPIIGDAARHTTRGGGGGYLRLSGGGAATSTRRGWKNSLRTSLLLLSLVLSCFPPRPKLARHYRATVPAGGSMSGSGTP